MYTAYSSALRVNSAQIPDLMEKLEKYDRSFDKVFFFSQFTHSVHGLTYHQQEAEKIRPALEQVKKLGIRAGINVLTTIGFFPEALDPEMAAAAPYRQPDGQFIPGRICPQEKHNLEYIREQYRIYARLSPDIIYIDDDTSSLSCACEHCLSRFSKIIQKSIPDCKALNQLLDHSSTQVRQQMRKEWIQFNALRIFELFSEIRTAVDEIDPGIELGAMSHMNGNDGLDTDHWANALRGKNKIPASWRPGGGAYTDFSLPEILNKANRISAQIRYLPKDFLCIESEIENFPYQSLRKSPSFTAFEAFLYQAAGCTGTAFNVLSKDDQIGAEHEIFFQMAQDASIYGRKLTSAFGRAPLSGVGFWWDKATATFPLDNGLDWCWKGVPSADDLHLIGLPYACAPANMQVFFLNRDTATQVPNDTLLELFSKGILMDAEALDILNQRGFGEYTGFQTTGTYAYDSLEQELPHALNLPGRHRRNLRQAFGWSVKDTYTIEKTNQHAEYIAEQLDLSGNFRGMSAGIFENSLGGRVAVDGISPFSWCYSLPKSVHAKRLLRWLSKDTLAAYVDSFHRASVWVRGNAVMAANMSTEDATDIHLLLKTNADRLFVTVTKGSKITKTNVLQTQMEANGYRAIIIPEIPICGTALITEEVF